MQARLAYAELITPPSQRRDAGQSHVNQIPAHRIPAHGFAYQGRPRETQTSWASSGTEASFDFGLGVSPRGQETGTSAQGGFQDSLSRSRSHSEDDALADIKRRKNTEASARFRVKKKEKMEQLEQNMTQLQQRAESLEKEAGDLRRENGWLKEMVIMKRGKGSSTSQGRPGEDEGGQYQEVNGPSSGSA